MVYVILIIEFLKLYELLFDLFSSAAVSTLSFLLVYVCQNLRNALFEYAKFKIIFKIKINNICFEITHLNKIIIFL